MQELREYGPAGATLVEQPEAMWTHRWTELTPMNGGGWHLVVPLWTTDESPSDLSAELFIKPDGTATIHDVHVL